MNPSNRDPVVLVAQQYSDALDELMAYSLPLAWQAPEARPKAEQAAWEAEAVRCADFPMRAMGGGVFESANPVHTGYVPRQPTPQERADMLATQASSAAAGAAMGKR